MMVVSNTLKVIKWRDFGRVIDEMSEMHGSLRIFQFGIDLSCQRGSAPGLRLQEALRALNAKFSGREDILAAAYCDWLRPFDDSFGSYKVAVMTRDSGQTADVWKERIHSELQAHSHVTEVCTSILLPADCRWITEIVVDRTPAARKLALLCLPYLKTRGEMQLESLVPWQRAFVLNALVRKRKFDHYGPKILKHND